MHQSHKHVEQKKPDQNKVICLFHLNLLLRNKQCLKTMFYYFSWLCGFSDVIWTWLIWWGWKVRGGLIHVSGGAWFFSTWPRPPSWQTSEQHSERLKVKLRGLWSHSCTSCTAFVFRSVKPSEETSAGSRGGEIGPTHWGEQLTLKGSDTQGGNLWPHLPSTTKQSDAISIK